MRCVRWDPVGEIKNDLRALTKCRHTAGLFIDGEGRQKMAVKFEGFEGCLLSSRVTVCVLRRFVTSITHVHTPQA